MVIYHDKIAAQEQLLCALMEYLSQINFLTAEFPGGAAAGVFANFVGEWQFRRTMAGIGSVWGQACFVPVDATSLQYREDGLLRMRSGFNGKVSKEYFYRLNDDQIQITFVGASSGNTTFIILKPRQGSSGVWAEDTHYCGSDVYRCTYRFESPMRFTVHIEVEGKNKKYAMVTAYEKALQ